MQLAVEVSKQYPVVVSEFIENAKEIEIDAVADKGEIILYAISEHIEFAGVHSGDATMVFPPQKIYFETVRRIKAISRKIASELNISGPFNIQFLAKDNDVKVIFFDGRGGPPARGGGKTHDFYASQGNTIANNQIELTMPGDGQLIAKSIFSTRQSAAKETARVEALKLADFASGFRFNHPHIGGIG